MAGVSPWEKGYKDCSFFGSADQSQLPREDGKRTHSGSMNFPSPLLCADAA
jgi:hypothetical protein